VAVSASLLLLAMFAEPAAAQTAKSVAGAYSRDQDPRLRRQCARHAGADSRTVTIRSSPVARRCPSFAAGARTKGTPEEKQAVIDVSIAHFGKYTIDDGGKSIPSRP